MIGDPYPFLTQEYISKSDTLFYIFISQGEELLIPKAVTFTPVEKDGQEYYNWGFGDLILNAGTGEYRIDDKIESNNGDAKTVFYTVVSTLNDFFNIHPQATVYIEGSSQQRKNVYRGLISRHWKQIEPIYLVKGCKRGVIQVFRPGVDFEYILISMKEPLNLESEK